MNQIYVWPALVVLAGTAASIPMIENSNNRSLLYWCILSPLALGMAGAFCLIGIH
jgi:hypothetical protein